MVRDEEVCPEPEATSRRKSSFPEANRRGASDEKLHCGFALIQTGSDRKARCRSSTAMSTLIRRGASKAGAGSLLMTGRTLKEIEMGAAKKKEPAQMRSR